MFEDFRKQMDDAVRDEDKKEVSRPQKPAVPPHYFLGLTPFQRFVLALLLLIVIMALGVLLLLVTGKIIPPS